ncbi:MAG: acetaldehyde dehydrogenase, partial [Chloroherpetonaceae bacterium]
GPGTIGGSITTDNITPLHLLNIKRIAFETNPVNDANGNPIPEGATNQEQKTAAPLKPKSFSEIIDERIRLKAGNPSVRPTHHHTSDVKSTTIAKLSDQAIEELVKKFKK